MIEFEAGKPFALRSLRIKTGQIKELMKKLVLTIIHFPSVSILWAASSIDSALIFSELKKDEDDPNIHDAAGINSDQDGVESKYNTKQVDMVLSLPGVNSGNVYRLLDNYHNLTDLSNATGMTHIQVV